MLFRCKAPHRNNAQIVLCIGRVFHFLQDCTGIQHVGHTNQFIRKLWKMVLQHLAASPRHHRNGIHSAAHCAIRYAVHIKFTMMPPCNPAFRLHRIPCQICANAGAKANHTIIMMFAQQQSRRRLQGARAQKFSQNRQGKAPIGVVQVSKQHVHLGR